MILQIAEAVIGEVLHRTAFEANHRQNAASPPDPGRCQNQGDQENGVVDLAEASARRGVNGINRELVEKPFVDEGRNNVAGDDGSDTGGTEQDHWPIGQRVPAKDLERLRGEITWPRGQSWDFRGQSLQNSGS